MAGSKPHILLIGGDGGLSGVPRYIEQILSATAGRFRFTVMSDVNVGGYEFVGKYKANHVTQPGLRTSFSILRTVSALRGIASQIDRDEPNLIWAHSRMAVLLLRLYSVWRRLRRRPLPNLAITLHGLPFGPGHRPVTGGLSRITELLFLRAMPHHHLLFLSDAALAIYKSSPGIKGYLSRHSTHVLENCANLEPMPREDHDGAPVVVMTGRAGYQKNHGLAARIFGKLQADFCLILCGAGTNDPSFRDRFIHQSGLPANEINRRVTFLGPIADVRPILDQADIFLSTSRYEGMPIAALEAFEAGLPIATTEISGMKEIVGAHPMADFIPVHDTDVAAKRIEQLVFEMRSDEMRHTRKIRTAFANRFSFSKWSENLVPLIEQLLVPETDGDAGRT